MDKSEDDIEFDLTFKPHTGRVEEAIVNFPGIWGLDATMDMITWLGTLQIKRHILKAQRAITVDVEAGEFMNLWLNAITKPLDDPRLRQAIACAIDRQAISEAAFFGYGIPLCAPPLPDHGITMKI